jgi:hypothetical protein
MPQRDADLLPPVLEHEDLLHERQRGQVHRTVDPCIEHQPDALGRQPAHRGVVVAREADDLAASETRSPLVGLGQLCRGVDPGGEGGKAVLEDHDVVVLGRDLGLATAAGRAQRALVGRRKMGSPLPMGGDGHPLVQQCVVPDL